MTSWMVSYSLGSTWVADFKRAQVLTDFFTRQAEVLVDGARHSEARQAEVLIGVHLCLEAVLGSGE